MGMAARLVVIAWLLSPAWNCVATPSKDGREVSDSSAFPSAKNVRSLHEELVVVDSKHEDGSVFIEEKHVAIGEEDPHEEHEEFTAEGEHGEQGAEGSEEGGEEGEEASTG